MKENQVEGKNNFLNQFLVVVQLVDYQLEVDKGKLTAVVNLKS